MDKTEQLQMKLTTSCDEGYKWNFKPTYVLNNVGNEKTLFVVSDAGIPASLLS